MLLICNLLQNYIAVVRELYEFKVRVVGVDSEADQQSRRFFLEIFSLLVELRTQCLFPVCHAR